VRSPSYRSNRSAPGMRRRSRACPVAREALQPRHDGSGLSTRAPDTAGPGKCSCTGGWLAKQATEVHKLAVAYPDENCDNGLEAGGEHRRLTIQLLVTLFLDVLREG